MSHTNHRRADKPPKRLPALPNGGRRDCSAMATHGREWMHARRKGMRRFWRALRRNGKLGSRLAFWAPRLAATGEALQPDAAGTPAPSRSHDGNQLGSNQGRARKWRLRHAGPDKEEA